MFKELHFNFSYFATLINPRDKRKLLAISIFQFFFNLLDLIAIALIGVIGSIAASAVQGVPVGNRVSYILSKLNIGNFSVNKQTLLLSFFAILLMSSKTFLSVISQRRILNFLGMLQTSASSRYFTEYIKFPLSKIQETPIQRVIYYFTVGVGNIFTGVIGSFTAIFTESLFLILMICAMLYVDPVMALSTLLIFLSFTIILYKLLQVRLKEAGNLNSSLHVEATENISDLISAYREIYIRNAISKYRDRFAKIQKKKAQALADLAFFPFISKYLMEFILIIGMFLVSAYQFFTNDARHSATVLLIFVATSSRLAPSVIRMQQSLIQLRSYYAGAKETIIFLRSIDMNLVSENIFYSTKDLSLNFEGNIKCKNLSARYPNSSFDVIRNINLDIKIGEFLAIVGPSGAGKSTLIDSLLGVLEPSNGEILISNMKPKEIIKLFPGKIAYVPQDVAILNDTIFNNLTLGLDKHLVTVQDLNMALEKAQLSDFVKSLQDGLESVVGDRGARLSGGQRQRLGIARALITKPEILILDEATSSLDGQTEINMVEALDILKGKITVIAIAHRLSSLRHADRVIYLDSGAIRAEGTFDEIRQAVPDFDEQAKLMGLN